MRGTFLLMPKSESERPYLAFDFGAESGRAVLAHFHGGVLTTQEIHRFQNEPVEYGGALHWDIPRLWFEVRKALASVEKLELAGIGVDAWGVDYALLGEQGELLQNPYHYRDGRTSGVMAEVFGEVPREEIYATTGIQFMPINTLYQLFAAQRDSPKLLAAAESLLTIPDLLHYWLTGVAVCEFTNATTTQMVSPISRSWAVDLITRLNLPTHLLAKIVEPGTVIGKLRPEIAGGSALFGTPVIAPASHDTGSAIAAISARNGTAFLSSGTWSLLGTELDAPVLTSQALRMNFSNEGGVDGSTRLLKNVMGLWMLQCCRRSWTAQGHLFDHDELMEMASGEPPFRHLVDPDDKSFHRPSDMPKAIDLFCRKTQQPIPSGPGAYVRAALESLAFKYRLVLHNLEQVTGTVITQIRIIGGGSKNRVLNQFTADATGCQVLAGPSEATAIGNVGVQLLATGRVSSLVEVRAMIDRSFPTEIFDPIDPGKWDQEAERFQQYSEIAYV
jgi:rhamnulokinase